MAGYSGTPLVRKLGIREGGEIFLSGAPEGYLRLLDPLPESVRFVSGISPRTDLIHLFAVQRGELRRLVGACRNEMAPDATIWVSWPKRASRVPTDISEDVVREIALPLGLVDVKVCAVDDVWSGLKLVVRKELR
jgi:hypothetical protein